MTNRILHFRVEEAVEQGYGESLELYQDQKSYIDTSFKNSSPKKYKYIVTPVRNEEK